VSDDSVPLALPLLRLAAGLLGGPRLCIAKLRKPAACATWSVWDLRATKRRMLVQDAFSEPANGIWASNGNTGKTAADGCFALPTIRRGIARRATIGDSVNRSTAKWIFWRTDATPEQRVA